MSAGDPTAFAVYRGAYGLGPRARISALKRAAELADAENNTDLAYMIRTELLEATYDVPGSDELVGAYAWCLARHDEDPERFPLELWFYKWVAHALPGYDSVSAAQITAVVDDLERRFVSAGSGPAPVLKVRLDVAMRMGRLDDVATHLDRWLASERHAGERFNDCAACDTSVHAAALVMLGEDRAAIDVARPLLERRLECGSEPHTTLATLLAPARRTGRHEDAAEWRTWGYRLVRDDPKYLFVVADHVHDAVERGRVPHALELVTRHLPWLREPQDAYTRLLFLRSARHAVLAARGGAGGGETAAVLDAAGRDGRSPEQVAHEICLEAERLARRFDERNGTAYLTEQLTADDLRRAGRRAA